jgi:hypothetical protein
METKIIFEGLSKYKWIPRHTGKAPRVNPQQQTPAHQKTRAKSPDAEGLILFVIVAIVSSVLLIVFLNPPSWIIAIFIGILVVFWSYSGYYRS